MSPRPIVADSVRRLVTGYYEKQYYSVAVFWSRIQEFHEQDIAVDAEETFLRRLVYGSSAQCYGTYR